MKGLETQQYRPLGKWSSEGVRLRPCKATRTAGPLYRPLRGESVSVTDSKAEKRVWQSRIYAVAGSTWFLQKLIYVCICIPMAGLGGLFYVVCKNSSCVIWIFLQMTGQTGSQRFMAPEVFDGMPYNEKVWTAGNVVWNSRVITRFFIRVANQGRYHPPTLHLLLSPLFRSVLFQMIFLDSSFSKI